MIVRWESDDLTEIIKRLLPAHIELDSLNGDHKYFSPDLKNSAEVAEGICCILMTLFLRNSLCSLMLMQEDKDEDYSLNCYLITTKNYDSEIVLSYIVVPNNYLFS